ncbi:MAG: secondary thiamine-phosphate synthase enzyme YjbQ [Candidatus Ancaeobacter aquaticus]|nr:secondary thiamine-phosphate synthase enzyme YjbQ [Candidatus Ancaeobacter aquaticus]
MLKKIAVKTSRGTCFIDITQKVSDIVSEAKIKSGMCQIYVPHTTAGLTINENADPSVVSDMIGALERIVPKKGPYRHLEGNSHAHIKSSMLGHSQTVIVQDRSLLLGTWQGIYFCEFDGPRSREVWISLIEG